MLDWISVKDKLPGCDEYVLWVFENGRIFFECIDKDENVGDFLAMGDEHTGHITHWAKANLPKE